jgi:hypothetical protein
MPHLQSPTQSAGVAVTLQQCHATTYKPFDRVLLDSFAASVRGRGQTCDVGCGPGHVARYLHERGVGLCAVVASPIQRVRRRTRPLGGWKDLSALCMFEYILGPVGRRELATNVVWMCAADQSPNARHRFVQVRITIAPKLLSRGSRQMPSSCSRFGDDFGRLRRPGIATTSIVLQLQYSSGVYCCGPVQPHRRPLIGGPVQ